MDFKSTLLQTDNKDNMIKVDKFYDWNTVNSMIDKYFNDIKDNSKLNTYENNMTDEKYNILSSSDDIIHNETKYLKDKFFFKGLLLNTDMEKLINIYVKNMHIEEIIDDNEDEEYYYEEEEIIL